MTNKLKILFWLAVAITIVCFILYLFYIYWAMILALLVSVVVLF